MPDRRAHRGPDPHDPTDFAPEAISRLREATADLAWLLGRVYPEAAALKLVGDRHALTSRQRMAVRRSACSDAAREARARRRIAPADLAGRPLLIDGFNVLTTVEAALGGAPLLLGRDGCIRDLAGVHGTYRRVAETAPAAVLLGQSLAALGVGPCTWFLDRPVSNSGRLRAALVQIAAELGWPWGVELPFNPDPILAASPEVVATADAGILDRCAAWVNLARAVIEAAIPSARVIDLGSGEPCP